MSRMYTRIAETRREIDLALRVRFQVFAEQLSYIPPEHRFVPREVDAFDTLPTTVHILAYSDDVPVGALRILGPNPEVARSSGALFGLDIESKFDISPLAAPEYRLAETMRFCVLAEHRLTGVASALHAAAVEISRESGVTHWLGCANVETNSLAEARLIDKAAQDLGLHHAEIRLQPVGGAPHSETRRASRSCAEPEPRAPSLPRTLQLYTSRMGARVVGPPLYDPRFRMCSIPILMCVDDQRIRLPRRLPSSPSRRAA